MAIFKPDTKTLSLRKVSTRVQWRPGGIVRFELSKPGETVTADLYCQQLRRLHFKLLERKGSFSQQKKNNAPTNEK